jgi:hypothetical protein
MQHLSGETNELRQHVMCEVLVETEAKKGSLYSKTNGQAIAQNLVKQMISDEPDPAKKANLEKALKDLEK